MMLNNCEQNLASLRNRLIQYVADCFPLWMKNVKTMGNLMIFSNCLRTFGSVSRWHRWLWNPVVFLSRQERRPLPNCDFFVSQRTIPSSCVFLHRYRRPYRAYRSAKTCHSWSRAIDVKKDLSTGNVDFWRAFEAPISISNLDGKHPCPSLHYSRSPTSLIPAYATTFCKARGRPSLTPVFISKLTLCTLPRVKTLSNLFFVHKPKIAHFSPAMSFPL